VALSRGQARRAGADRGGPGGRAAALVDCRDQVRIGAAVPLSRLEREIPGVFPALDADAAVVRRAPGARTARPSAATSAAPRRSAICCPPAGARCGASNWRGPGGLRDLRHRRLFLEAYRKTATHSPTN
jgi:hypothetical protein